MFLCSFQSIQLIRFRCFSEVCILKLLHQKYADAYQDISGIVAFKNRHMTLSAVQPLPCDSSIPIHRPFLNYLFHCVQRRQTVATYPIVLSKKHYLSEISDWEGLFLNNKFTCLVCYTSNIRQYPQQTYESAFRNDQNTFQKILGKFEGFFLN